MIWWLLLVLVIAGLAFVRLAPSDPMRWHVPVEAAEDRVMEGGAVRVIPGDGDVLARIDAAARALPRTRVLSGSVDEGRITYVTRTKWFGFPDYTTIELEGGMIRMFARLRFGRSDFGVNGARLERLVEAAER